MNNIHGLNVNERLHSLKVDELNREIEYLHLLREAERGNPGLLVRVGKRLYGLLLALLGWLMARQSIDSTPLKPAHKKTL
jgi:hypothetical protein